MSIFWRGKCRKSRGKRSILKGDNRGASMVAALVAIAFVGILASVVMTATVTNYQLKTMNYKAKKTFYSAESALEEIHAGLSSDCYDILEEQYLKAITKLTSYGTADPTDANDEANDDLRKGYLGEVEKLLRGFRTDYNSPWTSLTDYLTAFLTDTENASVVSVGNVESDLTSVTINDLVVQFRESDTDYFSTVAVDLVMDFPNVKFEFVNDRNTLKTYLNYCLIGMNGIDAGDNSTSSISGGAFAGNATGSGGLTINGGSTVNFVNGSCDTVLVSENNVNVMGTMNVDDGKIWAVNINVGDKVTSNGGVLNFADGDKAYAYVADDLNFIGTGSKVTLGGTYYGFGYSESTVGNSSAIVINGEKSVLDVANLNRMILGGRAYIDIGSGYMTADSIGLKGSQEIYLVPTAYMNCSNPYAVSDYIGDSSFVSVDLKALEDFFAYPYLDASTPYEVVEDNGTAYVYLKFKDTASQVKYVNDIINGDSADADIALLKKVLNRSASKFTDGSLQFWGSGSLSSSDMLSNGNLYQVEGGVISGNGSVTANVGNDTFVQACLDKSKRYSLLKMYLYDIGSESGASFSKDKYAVGVNTGDVVTIDGIPYIIDASDSYSIYNYVVDIDILEDFKVSVEKEDVKYLKENYDDYAPYSAVAVVATGGTYEIPDDKFSGVILGYDCDITVDHDFEGLILTNGRINITNSSKVNANHDLADKVIENTMLAQYFKAYQNSANSNQVDPSDITKGDLLGFNNWRKNYVVEETTGEATE